MTKKDRTIRILITAAAIAAVCVLAWYVGRPMIQFVSEPERFRDWLRARGIWGVLAFAMMNMLQVFAAVIPGGPFSMASGYAFGPVWGTVICLAATTTASVIIVLLIRRYGGRVIRFLSGKSPEEVNLFKNVPHLERVFFLVFLIPGSPKDVLTYAAGLTDISIGSWIVINLVGRIPGILLSVLGGDKLMSGEYWIAIVITLLTGGMYLAGMILYRKKIEQKKGL